MDQTLDTVRSFNSLSDPEGDPGSSEDQSRSLRRIQDAESTSPCIDGQHDTESLRHLLASPTYLHTDNEHQGSSHLNHATLPFHQTPDQLPELLLQQYAPIEAEQTESSWHNNRHTRQITQSSYGDRYRLHLPSYVLERSDADLIRHFFSGFSDAFDLGDPDRPFSSWLASRLLQSSQLLKSILTIASRHLGKEETNIILSSVADTSSDHTKHLPSITSIIDLDSQETLSVTGLLSRFLHVMEGQYLVF